MPPTPQEPPLALHKVDTSKRTVEPTFKDDSIVISGMSGTYPNANNIKEFADILYNKVNTVSNSESRWDLKHPEVSHYVGIAPNLDRFDAQFFMVHYRLGQAMDPMARKLLEHSFQAIYDAGLSPAHLSGKKIGVFIGSSFSDAEKSMLSNIKSDVGATLLGGTKSMYANRISYWLNVRGPSMTVDNVDTSSATALQLAFAAIRRGDCEAAIVGGSNLCLHPQAYIHHTRFAMISKDGKTKSFAENADGYVLADAVNVIFIQKAKDALRNYAQIVNVKTEYVSVTNYAIGHKHGYNGNSDITAKFIKDVYNELQVPPQAVEYVEAYGTGVPNADKCELESIAEAYCKDREDTLFVGSVTSNIGLSVAASGLCSITKVLLGYHRGVLAANLNCERPRKDVSALDSGKIRIATDHQPFRRTYTAINGTSASGINSHVLLRGHYKPKDLSRYSTSIPYLVALSGRQESSVKSILDYLKSHPVDAEEISLLHNIHSKNISGHLGRGYIILDTKAQKEKTVNIVEMADYFNSAKRPLWFVYSSMGSQWAGMGAQLMEMPIFASAIERCHQALAPMGLNIVDIICSPDKTIFDNILHSFVGITAIQVGLTDILRELGLSPDGIIGHSMGEIACAYADGTLTAEEMILMAYSRGRVSLDTALIRGAMAAVGLGYKEISVMCPAEIDVACHNSSQSCTISGPADVVRNFVSELIGKGIFAKEVQCSNISYHSRYIADAGPNLLKHLKTVIKYPKLRSKRWLSTSVPQEKWDEQSAKYSSAEYHTNNLLNPVLFEEACRLIPSNALLIEVAPHGLLQAILKQSMPDCRNIPLTRRGGPDNVMNLLRAIGNIYMEGYAVRLQALYPPVQFPVSTETPMLSHIVAWIHSETCDIFTFKAYEKKKATICEFVTTIHDNEHNYLQGHVIRNTMCYPFAAALVAVWDMFSMHMHLPKRRAPIIFQEVQLHAQPLLFVQKPLKLNVSLCQGTARFEVTSEYSKVISGSIIESDSVPHIHEHDVPVENMEAILELTSKDIYHLLNEKGHKYSGEFQSIEWASASLNKAALVWADNWVTFVDGILQLNLLRQPSHVTSLPTYIKRLRIDVNEHLNSHIHHLNGRNVMQAHVADEWTRCGGVVLEHVLYRRLLSVSRGLQSLELSATPNNVGDVHDIKVCDSKQTELVTLECEHLGKLNSLRWIQSPRLQKSKVSVTVHYAGINQIDVKKTIGIASSDNNTYGMYYSGITNTGERVMGIVNGGAASSQVNTEPLLLWPVPAHWSLEDAATVPYAYAYAFYALVIKGNIEPDMSILIHEGSDELGQAAIVIALAHHCKVFTTVSNNIQKTFLQQRFPQLNEKYIGNSRDVSFSDKILIATDGLGCDIVIACVKGVLKDMLQDLLSDGIVSGYVVPLVRVTYAPCHVQRAFELLHQGCHFGSVLLRMYSSAPQTQHRIICDPDKCQIVFSNNEVFGVQLAETLIRRGAKKLFICNTTLSSYQLYKIRSWKKLGVKLEVTNKELKNDMFCDEVLNEALNMENIEGIYVVLMNTNKNQSFRDFTCALDKLDLMSRSLPHQLKNFTVVSTMRDLGENVCLSRVKSGLAATWLDLYNLSNVCKVKEINDLDVVDAVETAQCSANVTLVAQIKQNEQLALFDQIIALAGVNITNHEDMDVSLKQLGMENEKISTICVFLNIMYNLSLDEQAIPLLTLHKLRELENDITDIEPIDVKGLSTFISDVYPDELLATLDLVVLSTLTHKVISVEYDYDISGQYLCIIPGIEGHHERFRLLCERLKLPAVVLQPGVDHPYETVRETAQRYEKILSKQLKKRNKFYILGYESGATVAMVALELAAILEGQGSTGTVFCLGCAPNEFQTEVEHQLREFVTEEQLQDAVVRHVHQLISGGVTPELNVKLRTVSLWAKKVEMCARLLLRQRAHSAQYARALLEAMLARLVAARHAMPATCVLHSKLVVLRASSPHLPPCHEAILQRLSHQPILLHQLQFPLSCVTTDMQCAALINQYLDDNILQEFDNKNLCECYIYNKR